MLFRSRLVRIFLLLSVPVLAPSPGACQGIPWYTIPLPVPHGLVDAATGNLHLEIPLGAMPQRNADPIISKMIYNTTYYYYAQSANTWIQSGSNWYGIAGNSHSGTSGLIGSGETCTAFGLNSYPNGSVSFWGGFSFTDFNGTVYALPNAPPYQTRQINCYDNFGHPFGSSLDVTSFSTSGLGGTARASM